MRQSMKPLKSESRFHERRIVSRSNGRTLASIACPFCEVTVEAYVWSLAGSGKRCECGALHVFSPAVTIRSSS